MYSGGCSGVPDLAFDLLRLLQDVVPIQLHGTLRGGEISRNDVHGGGFPRAVGAKEAQDLPLVDKEVQVVNRDALAVLFRDALDLYQGILLSTVFSGASTGHSLYQNRKAVNIS